jgi:hypothetical protein
MLVPLLALFPLAGCGPSWTFSTQSPETRYYFDAGSAVQVSSTGWEVKERFLDVNTDRWSLETVTRYDCEARTFMTLTVREFSEHRPLSKAATLEGNEPVMVRPGSHEEARLDAFCDFVRG